MSPVGREADAGASASASKPTAAPAAARAATVAPLPALRGRCVLVVDDSVPVARSTARLLELFGAVAVMAHSGADALRRLELADFDLLVVDLGLPDLDGREVLRRARQRRPAQAALFVSGLPCDDALPAGVALVAKPFQLATLLSAVEGALAQAVRPDDRTRRPRSSAEDAEELRVPPAAGLLRPDERPAAQERPGVTG